MPVGMSATWPSSMLACSLLLEDDRHITVACILANEYINSAFLLDYDKDSLDYVLD